ncbi:MAG: hypothetical protein L5655_12080 [Thermosediminibacteraceae bacterium]|nr:hypothetical protein [Thermosediminibacteraceae bacterium]
MKKIIFLLLILALTLALISCNNSNQAKNAPPLAVRGVITKLDNNGENVVITVESKRDEDTAYDKARVTIEKNTKIYEKDKEITASDLREYMFVEVYYDGVVAESYPVQMGADKIVVVARPAIIGIITDIGEENGKTTIMVEGEKIEGTISDKAKITLDEKTEIYQSRELEEWKELSSKDLTLYTPVVVYFDGVYNTSYPVQMGADMIVVLPIKYGN